MASTSSDKMHSNNDETQPKKRRITETNDSVDDVVIYLNVGGEKMTAKRSTLTQVQGTWLASCFSGRWEDGLVRDKDNCAFLDFNPKYFKLILAYLREKLCENPEHPARIPQVLEEESQAFENFVSYLGFTEEFAFNQKPCVFGSLHSVNAVVHEDMNTVGCDEFKAWDWQFVLSDTTYTRKGVFTWKFLVLYPDYRKRSRVFVGILKDNPDVYMPHVTVDSNKAYEYFQPGSLAGSYGWIVEPGRESEAVINGGNHTFPDRTMLLDDARRLTLRLDFQQKHLDLVLQSGRQSHIPLPSDTAQTVWRLYVGFDSVEHVKILKS